MRHGLCLLTVFVTIIASSVFVNAVPVLDPDASVILDLINSIPALQSSPFNWNTTTPDCSWASLVCDNTSRITQIRLRGASINPVPAGGVILPESIGNLTALQILEVSSTNTGSVPSTVLNLNSLTQILIQQMAFNGTIDVFSWIANLPSLSRLIITRSGLIGSMSSLPASLTYLDLNSNSITGTIPAPLPTSLSYMNLQRNKLTGSIPALPSSLQQLDLFNNQLTGNVPVLPDNMTFISLESNKLTGSIPSIPSAMQSFNLASNSLTGPLPALPPGLKTLKLNTNNISGSIPTAIPPTLGNLDLGNNNFTGLIPTFVSTNSSSNLTLTSVRLDNNPFTPDLMPIFPNSVTNIYVKNTNLTGTLPPLPPSLQVLDLTGNHLTGPLPIIPNLTEIYLSGNNFTSIRLDSLPNTVKTLSLPGMGLTGSIPDNLPATLTKIDLSRNNFTGQIPNFAMNLTDLSLGNNRLTSFPTSFPSTITTMNLSFNNLTGQIPPLPESLLRMDFRRNQITAFPTSFPSRLQWLELSYNNLTGKLPDFPNSVTDINIRYNQLTHFPSSFPTKLNWLDMGNNAFQEPISNNLPDSLKHIDIHESGLIGGIPKLPAQLIHLFRHYHDHHYLIPSHFFLNRDLFINNLTGPIPSPLPSSLVHMYLFQNQLNGTIPALPDGFNNLNLQNNQLTGPVPVIPKSLGLIFLNDNFLNGSITDALINDPPIQACELSRNYLICPPSFVKCCEEYQPRHPNGTSCALQPNDPGCYTQQCSSDLDSISAPYFCQDGTWIISGPVNTSIIVGSVDSVIIDGPFIVGPQGSLTIFTNSSSGGSVTAGGNIQLSGTLIIQVTSQPTAPYNITIITGPNIAGEFDNVIVQQNNGSICRKPRAKVTYGATSVSVLISSKNECSNKTKTLAIALGVAVGGALLIIVVLMIVLAALYKNGKCGVLFGARAARDPDYDYHSGPGSSASL